MCNKMEDFGQTHSGDVSRDTTEPPPQVMSCDISFNRAKIQGGGRYHFLTEVENDCEN
jgi:hypothetical protein